MRLGDLLATAKPAIEEIWRAGADSRTAPPGAPACALFLSASDGRERARVAMAGAEDFAKAWRKAANAMENWWSRQGRSPIWLRVDLVHAVQALTWQDLQQRFAVTKRNYFRQGIAFARDLSVAVLEQEIGANALLYSNQFSEATPNAANLKVFGKNRFGRELQWPEDPQQAIWLFDTRGVFTDGRETHLIEAEGRFNGYRQVPRWDADFVHGVVDTATAYLSQQVKASGEYHYGWFPCFDRPISTYNTLRHASSTYALLEGWEVTGKAEHKAAIDRALACLTQTLIRRVSLPDGTAAAFLVDTGDEIKLGGNAVCLLALVKYTELTGDRQYLSLMGQLALGIVHMQNPKTGRFVHVLNYPDLSIKAQDRIIYYDGEAAFGLMRLYGLTRDPRWIRTVEKAFEYFIQAGHWRAHDHWLSYCVNELTQHRPDERYYRFGLDNVRGHLDFVLERITTFPTLLELMMAAQKMIERLQADAGLAHLLEGFDLEKFESALEFRARYLLNGHFWPELAMFFRNPARIVGSFFIRHHGFRVRIDDVEHYLSGYIAYGKYARRMRRRETTNGTAVVAVPENDPGVQ